MPLGDTKISGVAFLVSELEVFQSEASGCWSVSRQASSPVLVPGALTCTTYGGGVWDATDVMSSHTHRGRTFD